MQEAPNSGRYVQLPSIFITKSRNLLPICKGPYFECLRSVEGRRSPSTFAPNPRSLAVQGVEPAFAEHLHNYLDLHCAYSFPNHSMGHPEEGTAIQGTVGT